MSALATAALRLAMRRISVLPLVPMNKAPLIRNGFHGASCDPEMVRSWWRRWPEANIGAPTGHRAWVLDVDGPRGAESLAALELSHTPLPPTTEVLTGTGRHLYFQSVDGLRNSASRVGPRLDVRAQGGYSILPPSVHPSGRTYRWGNRKPLAPAPTWLIELALPPNDPAPPVANPGPPLDGIEQYVAAAVVAELSELERATEGCRNDRLNRASFSLAGFVRDGLLPEYWAISQLEAHAVNIGLPVSEIRRTISSAFSAAQPREIPR